MTKEIGITVKKSEDFSEWYTQVVLKAELADYAMTKGFMILRPHGYSIWEMIQNFLDHQIKTMGVRNAYFPLLIPESLLRTEADHFSGFVPEVFWVTKAGSADVGERLAARPTSESIAYSSFGKWIKSWRDLPLKLNIWNSVLRAEITGTKPFIRTSEFLWQEGHTVHANEDEAKEQVLDILNLYRTLIEDLLAVPVYVGYKTEKEKFVGAAYTTTLEAMMPDGRALQMGTSHNLGQNFSKPFEIRFLGSDKKEHYAWQTSWGVSWRLIGSVVMIHGDDKGLVLPPKVSPIQCVIIPIYYDQNVKEKVLLKSNELCGVLNNALIRVHVDKREQYTPGWKFNDWEMKGIPLRVEIGPRDLENNEVTLVRRDTSSKIKVKTEFVKTVSEMLNIIQSEMLERARQSLIEQTSEAQSYDELSSMMEAGVGFVKAGWCGSEDCENNVKDKTGADVRLLPLEKEELSISCIICGNVAKHIAYFARAY